MLRAHVTRLSHNVRIKLVKLDDFLRLIPLLLIALDNLYRHPSEKTSFRRIIIVVGLYVPLPALGK